MAKKKKKKLNKSPNDKQLKKQAKKKANKKIKGHSKLSKKQIRKQNLLKEKLSDKKTIIMIAAVILSVLIIAIVVSLLLSGGNTDDANAEPTPTPTPTPTAQPTEEPPDEPNDDDEDPDDPDENLSEQEKEFLNYEGPEMIMYHIWPDTFRELIETADRNLMLDVEQVVHYRPADQEDVLLRFMLIHERAETLFFRDEAMEYGVPGLTIDTTLFETFSRPEEIEKILRENGINESVTDHFIFIHELNYEQGIPPTAVVYTGNNVYFISIETIDGAIVNHVYSQSEYREKYRVHDGTLIVNDTIIPVPAERLTFEYRQMLAPLRVILEAIGCEIEIESEETEFEEIFRYGADNLNITMFFSRNGKGYALEIERWAPGIVDLATGNYLNYVFPQDHLHFIHGRYSTMEDFEFYVDETVLRSILELVDATVEVDYETRLVRVTS